MTGSIIRRSGEGEQTWFFGGGVHTWKARAAESNGSFSVFEDTMERGKATPLHHHPDHDELVFVIEGELLLHDPAGDVRVGAGTTILNPRGVAHAFVVLSERARVLSIQSPGKGEEFYRRASQPVGQDGSVDFTKVRQAAQETGGMVFLGPPPFKSA